MRRLGLASAGQQVRLEAMAYNLRRTVTLLHASMRSASRTSSLIGPHRVVRGEC